MKKTVIVGLFVVLVLVSQNAFAEVDKIDIYKLTLESGFASWIPSNSSVLSRSTDFDSSFSYQIEGAREDFSSLLNRRDYGDVAGGVPYTGEYANLNNDCATSSYYIWLKIRDLNAGRYILKTWHNAYVPYDPGTIDIFITDTTRTDVLIQDDFQQGTPGSVGTDAVETIFTSNGSDDVVLTLIESGSTSGWNNPVINGFTLEDFPVQNKAYNPDPCDGKLDTNLGLTLSWEPGENALTHSVYLGTGPGSLSPISTGQTETSLFIQDLNLNTTYYWRVDEVNGPTTWAGDVWNFTTASVMAQNNYYVAPGGNDVNPGTKDLPFGSITRARDVIRGKALPFGGINVWLRGGVYPLSEPIVFESQDSGTDFSRITYKAYPGKNPVLSGAEEITGWTNISGNLWTMTIPEVASGSWWFRQLWRNNQRCERSRWPNETVNDAADLLRITATSNGDKTLTMDQPVLGSDFSTYGTEINVRSFWVEAYAKVISKDSADTITTATTPGNPDNEAQGPKPGTWQKPAYLINHPDFIDQDTEWHLNPTTGLLTYLAPPGTNPNNEKFYAPKLTQLLIIKGTSAEPVQKLIFKGISFRHTKWDIPDDGYAPTIYYYYRKPDFSMTVFWAIHPAVLMHYAFDCVFQRCDFVNLASNAVGIGTGCKNSKVQDCEIEDVGGVGIICGWKGNVDTGIIGVSTGWANPSDMPTYNKVLNNHINNACNEQRGWGGIVSMQTENALIKNNFVQDLPYCGIVDNGFSGTTVQSNHIYNVMQNFNDGAALYTSFDHLGGFWLDNWMHGIGPGWQVERLWLCIGIYLDSNSANLYIANNITNDLTGLDYFEHPTDAEPIHDITLGDNYWSQDPYNPAESNYSIINSIAQASGVHPNEPNIFITLNADYNGITVTGSVEAWAGLNSVVIQESSQDVSSFVNINANGEIYGNIPMSSIVSTELITLGIETSDPESDISAPGYSNTITFYKGDINGDGIVNFIDYSILVQFWHENEPSVDVSPFSGDDIIDEQDFVKIIENWLWEKH